MNDRQTITELRHQVAAAKDKNNALADASAGLFKELAEAKAELGECLAQITMVNPILDAHVDRTGELANALAELLDACALLSADITPLDSSRYYRWKIEIENATRIHRKSPKLVKKERSI